MMHLCSATHFSRRFFLYMVSWLMSVQVACVHQSTPDSLDRHIRSLERAIWPGGRTWTPDDEQAISGAPSPSRRCFADTMSADDEVPPPCPGAAIRFAPQPWAEDGATRSHFDPAVRFPTQQPGISDPETSFCMRSSFLPPISGLKSAADSQPAIGKSVSFHANVAPGCSSVRTTTGPVAEASTAPLPAELLAEVTAASRRLLSLRQIEAPISRHPPLPLPGFALQSEGRASQLPEAAPQRLPSIFTTRGAAACRDERDTRDLAAQRTGGVKAAEPPAAVEAFATVRKVPRSSDLANYSNHHSGLLRSAAGGGHSPALAGAVLQQPPHDGHLSFAPAENASAHHGLRADANEQYIGGLESSNAPELPPNEGFTVAQDATRSARVLDSGTAMSVCVPHLFLLLVLLE